MEWHPGTVCQGSLAKSVKHKQDDKGRRAQNGASEAKQGDNSIHKQRWMMYYMQGLIQISKYIKDDGRQVGEGS